MCLEITITTRKQLEIYMNPQRQRLLKILELNGAPMTPKQLSLRLDISPSSVTHHLKKLEQLGLVKVDHTERIHGIQASFYRLVPAMVNLKGNTPDDLQAEKMLIAEYSINDTWTDFKKYLSEESRQNGLEKTGQETGKKTGTQAGPLGDYINGIYYLTDEEAEKIRAQIMAFQKEHLHPREDAKPWEVALVAFPRKEKLP